MAMWVASTFWLRWILLLWTWVYRYLFESLLSFLLGIGPEVEFLGHIVMLCLKFWGISRLFSKAAAPCCIPIRSMWGSQFPGSSLALAMMSLWSSHLSGCEVVSHHGFDFYIPDNEWRWTFFHVLRPDASSSLGICLFKSWAHWKMWLSFLWLSYKLSVYFE